MKKNHDTELKRYIEQTNEIRELSSPQIRDISGANKYHDMLLRNYARIAELSRDNGEILREFFFPSIEAEHRLSDEEIEQMRRFSDALIDPTNLNNHDSAIVYRQAERMLEEADQLGDDELRIMALDGMVMAAYPLMCMTLRLLPVNDVCFAYKHAGMKAGEKLLEYLDKEKFAKLSEPMKELIVINARYIRVVSEVDDVPGDPKDNAVLLKRMLDALALADDPFYVEQLPSYNWKNHRFRVYEYISSLTDLNNVKQYKGEQLQTIYNASKKLRDIYLDEHEGFKEKHLTKNMELFLARNAYLAGETDLETYKATLVSLMMKEYREEKSENVPVVMLLAPLEYILVLDRDKITSQEASYLNYFYGKLISYIHETPRKDLLTFILTALALILRHFIEVPGGMKMETIGVSLLAALHPPTYVHTLSVADFAKCLTHHLLQKKPELFVGMLGYGSTDMVSEHTAEIENYVYHASLCHDFGKLAIAETIMTYGRSLLEDEFAFIRVHPLIGAHLLENHPGTAAYADVARGHHKWFNDKGGYPEDFVLADSPYKTAISIVACADCLDAATDAVGRSYKQGKTLDEFLGELREGSGTRYAPYLIELLEDPVVRGEIETLMIKGRDENYRKTYFTLKRFEAD